MTDGISWTNLPTPLLRSDFVRLTKLVITGPTAVRNVYVPIPVRIALPVRDVSVGRHVPCKNVSTLKSRLSHPHKLFCKFTHLRDPNGGSVEIVTLYIMFTRMYFVLASHAIVEFMTETRFRDSARLLGYSRVHPNSSD